MKINRRLLFFPALGVGILVLILVIKASPEVPIKPAIDKARLVDVVTMTRKEIAPEAIGFGKVVPKFEWKAIAEVTGEIVYRHSDLERGRTLPAGTEVLRIDPLDYELKLNQAQADLSSSETQLKKLALEHKNRQSSIKIEKERLTLFRAEWQRQLDLQKKKLAAQSNVDTQQQAYLAQQKLVQDIENQLALYPNEKKVAQMLVEVNHSRVKEAERALEKTKVILPRSLRIADVGIELNQVVNLQQEMLVAHGLDVVEVEAQLSIHEMFKLTSSLENSNQSAMGSAMPDISHLEATVTLSSGTFEAVWPAKVARVSETIDPNQATVGVILEIEKDASNTHMQLANGMFVRAEIQGVKSPQWVIPERALHGDRIYLFRNNKLEILPVKVLYRRDQKVVIEGDITEGEQIILNDLLPAIPGMGLKLPVEQEVAA